jgi:hypothetical protein
VLHIHNSGFENTCSHNPLGKHCQIMFLRTFGGRRPPTGVFRVSGLSAPGLPRAIFFRSAGGRAFSFLTPIFSERVGVDFFFGGSAMRCRVPSSSAMDEIVPKQNTDPGRKVILL